MLCEVCLLPVLCREPVRRDLCAAIQSDAGLASPGSLSRVPVTLRDGWGPTRLLGSQAACWAPCGCCASVPLPPGWWRLPRTCASPASPVWIPLTSPPRTSRSDQDIRQDAERQAPLPPTPGSAGRRRGHTCACGFRGGPRSGCGSSRLSSACDGVERLVKSLLHPWALSSVLLTRRGVACGPSARVKPAVRSGTHRRCPWTPLQGAGLACCALSRSGEAGSVRWGRASRGGGGAGGRGGGTRTRPPARSPETHPDGPKLCACVSLHGFSGD